MSGNSGAEQLNNNVSVPDVEIISDGAETPIEVSEEVIINETEEEISNSEILEEKPLVKKDKIVDNIEENNINVIEEFSAEKEVKNESESVDEIYEEIPECVVDNSPIIEENIEIDKSEVIGGFEETRRVLKEIYLKALNEAFKPSLNDATVDLLAFIGAKADSYNRSMEFKDTFGVDSSRFAERYRDNSYVPIAFKISVWADKNKGLDKTIDLLNGILQTLFALNVGKSEVETVKTVKDSVLGIIKYLEGVGINSGF